MAKNECFVPEFLKNINDRSYRYYYKWGDKSKFYIPSNRTRLFEYLRDELSLDEDFFASPNYANDRVELDREESNLDNKDIEYFRSIVGTNNVFIDIDRRIKASITKSHDEIALMHKGVLPPIVDAVICPNHEHDLMEVLAYARKRRIKVVIKSSLLPKTCGRRTIAIDLTASYNKILEFSEVDGYAVVEAGMYLDILENIMNNAPENFGDYNIENRYTLGHFPLEYEECTLLDADNGYDIGREAGFYGRFNDMVIDREYVTADGKTNEYVEGAVLSRIKLRLTKYFPHNRYGFSFMFRNFQDALSALREMHIKNAALPTHIKLSGPKETSLLMRYYMLDDTLVDSYLKNRKCIEGERCLLVGFSGGPYSFSRLSYNTCRKIARKYKAKSLTTFVADAYDDSKYREMYIREALDDFGIGMETEKHTLSWSEIPRKYMELSSEEGFLRSHIIAPTANNAVLEVVKIKVDS